VRAELMLRLGEGSWAAEQFDLAIARCPNNTERAHLRSRRAAARRRLPLA
jgi:predicted RNA polymerase sigma factor